MQSTSPLRGTVFTGGGHHAATQRQYWQEFAAALGYRPYEGSLNVRIDQEPDLGPPKIELSVGTHSRPRLYRIWRGVIRTTGEALACHLMIPGKGAHPRTVEALSPVRLRDALDLIDGSVVEIEVVR